MAKMSEEVFAYVGISACGCVRAATVDRAEHQKETYKDVSAFIRTGDKIERWPIEEVRRQLCLTRHPFRGKQKGCPHPGNCPARQPLDNQEG